MRFKDLHYLSVSKNCVSVSWSKQITCTCVAYCFFLVCKVKLSTERHNTIWIDMLLFSAATSCTSNKGHINIIMDCMKVLLTLIYYKACWPSARGFKLSVWRNRIIMIWAATWQNQQNESVTSEDSDQPGHPPSLIRVLAVCMKKAWVLSYPLSPQRRLIRLIWVFAGHRLILLVLSCCGSYHNNPVPSDRQFKANSVNPDHATPEGAVWSGSALFPIRCTSFGCITLW